MILRTELRRSTAPVAGVVLLVASLGLLYSLSGPWDKGSAQWDEQWTGLAQWTRYILQFVWPLVVGIGAWQGLRDHRSRVTELFSTTPRPAWRRVLMTAAALAIALTTAYLVLLVIGGVQVAGTATYVHLKWVPVAGVAVLALVGSALLAAGIGRLLPSPITPPVLAVAALALEVAALHAKWLLLTPGFREVDIQVFTSVVLPVTLAQALWFLGFGATGFALLFAVSGRTRLFAVLPLAVAAVVAVPVVSTVADPAVPDPDAQTLVCDEHGPRVCVTIAHADYLSALTGPAREALALLHKLPSPPTSVVEMGMPRPRRSDPDVVPMFIDPGRLPDPDTVRWQVLVRSAQPLCGPEGDDIVLSVTATQVIVSSWLTDAPTPISAPGQEYEWEYAHAEIKEGWAVLKALPPDRQAARVAEMRRAALDCRVFDLGTR